MSTSSSNICPQCGALVATGAPEGLCPRCVAALNLYADTALTGAAGAGAQPVPTPEEIAAQFPQLDVLEFLGRGGMGIVYKARQKALGRIVALKLLAPERVADPKFAERFAHEAKALAALSHPNIVTIHDFGQAGGFFFLLMEFVDGVNLRQAMKGGRFTPEQALAIVPPVCEALQYAHEHGIVHRDIKPENLLLDKEGRVKIADFGIAKILGAETPGVGLAETQPAGTPQYMAPEQKEHRVTDHRADIYSLGVVLYEMLTGELPADKLQAPSKRVQVDVRIDEIVLRALETKPEKRYQTAGEFRTQVVTMNGGADAPSVEPSVPNGSASFSRAAIIGACWVPISLFGILLTYFLRSATGGSPAGVESWGFIIVVPAMLLAVTGPFGTTILGWVAVSQIRHSAGRIQGLRLAVIDGLLYPLMALSGVIAFAGVATAAMFVDFYWNPAAMRNPAMPAPLVTRMANWLSENTGLAVFVAVVVAVAVDVLIVRAVLRAVHSPVKKSVAPPPRLSAEGNESTMVAVAMVFALLSSALGLLAAFALSPSLPIALAMLIAGFAILMAWPVRRQFAGKSALIAAAAGILIWPLAAYLASRERDRSNAEATADANAFAAPREGRARTFGPVIERVLSGVNGNMSYWVDLDTGRELPVPSSIGESALKTLVRKDGLDVMGIATDKEFGLSGNDMTVLQVVSSRWEDATVDEVIAETQAAARLTMTGEPATTDEVIAGARASATLVPSGRITTAAIPTRPEDVVTLFFRTREGGAGVLQLQGRTEEPSGLKFRCKLVVDAATQLPFIPVAATDASKGAVSRREGLTPTEDSPNAGQIAEDNQIRVRQRDDWTPTLLALSRKVAESRELPGAKPEELIAWGSEKDGMRTGLLIPASVAQGGRLPTRLVLRNVSGETKALRLSLTKYVVDLSAREARSGTIHTDTPLLLGSNAISPVTLKPGEQIEMEGWTVQFGGNKERGGELASYVETGPGKVLVKFNLQNLPLPDTGEALIAVGPAQAAEANATETRPFALRHLLASDMVSQLRQILLGRPGNKAVPSVDNQEVVVTAPPEMLNRVRTYIAVTDWPDAILRGSNFQYPRQTVMGAARSFFYACAIEDAPEALSNLLSVGVLAELKGEAKGNRFYETYLFGGVPDAAWENALRADWPGKKEALERLVHEWNRYPLKRISEDPGVAIGFGVKHFCSVSFDGAPKEFYQVTIEPGRTAAGTSQDSYFFSSLPPWWEATPKKAAALEPAKPAAMARVATKPGTYDLQPGLKLIITDHKDVKKTPETASVEGQLIWQAPGAAKPADTFDFPLSDGLPYVVAWPENATALWVSCGAKLGTGGEEHLTRYLRTLTIRGSGEVEEQSVTVEKPREGATEHEAYQVLPAEVRQAFEALDK